MDPFFRTNDVKNSWYQVWISTNQNALEIGVWLWYWPNLLFCLFLQCYKSLRWDLHVNLCVYFNMRMWLCNCNFFSDRCSAGVPWISLDSIGKNFHWRQMLMKDAFLVGDDLLRQKFPHEFIDVFVNFIHTYVLCKPTH